MKKIALITSLMLIPLLIFFPQLLKGQDTVSVNFRLTVNCHTPSNETVCLYYQYRPHCEPQDWVPMNKINDHTWEVTIDDFDQGTEIAYLYCRNYMMAGAEEKWPGEDKESAFRKLSLSQDTITVNDTVNEWRWWPVNGVIPAISKNGYLSSAPNHLPKPGFFCGVALPDFWWLELKPNIEPTLDEIIKKTRSDWITYIPIIEVKQYSPFPVIDDEGECYTPEDVLIYIIQQAHKRGLKVYLKPMLWPVFVQDNTNFHSVEWWNRFESQWRPMILNYASIAEAENVEMLGFEYWPRTQQETNPAALDRLKTLTSSLLKDVREQYSGKITLQTYFADHYPEFQVFSDVDYLTEHLCGWYPYDLSESFDPTVKEMRDKLLDKLENRLKNYYEKYGNPILFHAFGSGSYDGASTSYYNEDDLAYWFPDDPSIPVDLQEQSDVCEALFQGISQKEWIKGAFCFGYNYWSSHDKTSSIHGKPVEKQVFAKWYKWFSPDRLVLSVSSSDGGNTSPSPASYVKMQGNSVTIQANSYQAYKFSHWAGDCPPGYENINPISITMDSDKSIKAEFEIIAYAPLNFIGEKKLNRSLSQSEYINVLLWEENPDNSQRNIWKYRIYQIIDDVDSLLIELDSDVYTYNHRDVEKDTAYTYKIVCVDEKGMEGISTLTTVQ